MEQDPLFLMEKETWSDIQKEFERDYPRGVTGYNLLQTQRQWLEQGIDFEFKVFCPFGEAKNGIVAVLNEKAIYEFHIECPTDDTSKLEEALLKTRKINWDRDLRVLFPPFHVVEGLKRVVKEVKSDVIYISKLHFYLLDRNKPLFDISLPSDITFQPLSPEYINLVDSTWPHRYPGSTEYFRLLIQAKSAFGLFKNDQLVAFGFIKETGALGHIFTLEHHRRKGYMEMFLTMLCNLMLKDGRHLNSYCVDGNEPACRLHKKLGFKMAGEVASVYIGKEDD